MAVLTLGASCAFAEYTRYEMITPSVALGSGSTTFTSVAVNRNTTSPYYGYVYVANATASGGIRIYRPDPISDRTAARSYVLTNMSVIPPGTLGSTNPYLVDIGDDDTVWISEGSATTTVRVDSAPHPTNSTPVQAVTQISTTNAAINARGFRVIGTFAANNIRVFISRNNRATCYGIAGGDPDTPGTWSTIYDRALGYFPYGIAVDSAGNAYFAKSVATGNTPPFYKLPPDGSGAEGAEGYPLRFGSWPTWASNTTIPSGAGYVADPSVPGGGYLYYSARFGSSPYKVFAFRFALDGTFLDGYGPTTLGTYPMDGTYTVLDIPWTGSSFRGANPHCDDRGNVYQMWTDSSNSSVLKVVRTAYYPTAAAVKSSPTIGSTGAAYFGSNDGKLYGINPVTGAPASGFTTYDITGVAGAGTTVLSRPSVYSLNGSPTVLFTSNNGYLFGLDSTGTPAFTPVQLVTGETTVSSSPMVFNNEIWVPMKNGSKVTLFKTDSSGTHAQSMDFTSDTDVKSSPSVFGPSAFIGTYGGVYRVASDLTVNNTVASVGASGSPFIANTSTTPIAFTATVDGKVYAANATNGTALTSFGTGGVVDLGITVASGDKISGSLFAYNGKLYIPGMDNKVYCLNISNGSGGGSGGSVVFFEAGSTGAVAAGVAVDPSGSGSVVFGSTDGRFYQVRLSDPSVYKMTNLGSAVNTTPTVDRTNRLVLVGTDAGRVHKLPSF